MSRPMNKDEYRREMAEAFAHVLEEKGLSWKKEWQGAGAAPHNAITKANYRGSNAFWLKLVAAMKGYSDPRWVTMVQIMDNDAKYHPKEKWHLKAGSKATYVEYWYPFDLKSKKALTWEKHKQEIQDGRREDEFKLSTRYIPVFNASMVEGMPAIPEPEQTTGISMDELVSTLSKEMGVPIYLDGGDQAFYSPYKDEIHLPTPGSFENEYAFNATALHELSHSTGHPSRLNRPQSSMFGTAQYAYEELVAEMCSCFMGYGLEAEASSEHLDNHKAYVQNWIQAIRERPETLIRAIRDAQSSASYMDYKAGLISEKEYNETKDQSFEIRIRDGLSRAETR